MVQFIDFNKMEWQAIPGLERIQNKPVSGQKLWAALGHMEPDFAPDSFHAHPEEQIDYVLQGTIELRVQEEGEEKRGILGPGMGYLIEANVPHLVRPIGEEKVILFEIKG